jgi:hypothetical protein
MQFIHYPFHGLTAAIHPGRAIARANRIFPRLAGFSFIHQPLYGLSLRPVSQAVF